jgi:hypothetical protein
MGPKPQQGDTPGLRRHARRFQRTLRREGPAQEPSVPRDLAGARLGSRRSETGPFEVGFEELARVRRGHEAHFTWRG